MNAIDFRSEVRWVLEEYLYALDTDDFDALAGCFTDDADISYDLKPHTFVGGRALADWIAAAHESNGSITLHTLGNVRIVRDGSTVSASSHVVANLGRAVDSGYTLKLRGIRYDDELTETSTGWKISRRVHRPMWQGDTIGGPLADIIDVPPAAQ